MLNLYSNKENAASTANNTRKDIERKPIMKQANPVRLRPKNTLLKNTLKNSKFNPIVKLPLVSKEPHKHKSQKHAPKQQLQIFEDEVELATEAELMETSLDEEAMVASMEDGMNVSGVQEDTQVAVLLFNDVTYIHEIYDYCRQREKVSKADNYLRKQKEISTDMRTILIDWLIEVSFSSPNNYYSPDVLPLATNIIDRFLSRMGVPKTKLQLLGIVCLMLASKMLDTIPPDVLQLCELTDNTYSSNQVKRMEILVLETLNFDMYPPSFSNFFNYYLQIHSAATPDIDESAIDRSPRALKRRSYSSLICQFITEMSLLDYRLSIHFLGSTISLGAVLMMRLVVKKCLDFVPSESSENTQLEKSGILQEMDKRERALVEDIRENGVCSESLATLIQEVGADQLNICMAGIATLWRSILGQEKIIAVIEKFCRPVLVENFIDFKMLCLYGAPTAKEIEQIFL